MHNIQAYVAKFGDLKGMDLPAVSLPHGFGIVPFDKITDPDKCSFPIALVETNYFGGSGCQGAAAWNADGEVVYSRFENEYDEEPTQNPINKALKIIGVVADQDKDEFDTINLGRYRENDDIDLSIFNDFDFSDDY